MTLTPEMVRVVVDTREQTPWNLEPLQTVRGTLQTGDYSIQGLESVVAIERKSLSDLLCCCGRERERFDKEIQRLRGYEVRALVVESSWSEIERGEWRSELQPSHVLGSLLGWIASGLPVILAGDHHRAGRYASRLLWTAARRRWRENYELTRAYEKTAGSRATRGGRVGSGAASERKQRRRQ